MESEPSVLGETPSAQPDFLTVSVVVPGVVHFSTPFCSYMLNAVRSGAPGISLGRLFCSPGACVRFFPPRISFCSESPYSSWCWTHTSHLLQLLPSYPRRARPEVPEDGVSMCRGSLMEMKGLCLSKPITHHQMT